MKNKSLGGGIGRRKGFKIPFRYTKCRFKSGPRQLISALVFYLFLKDLDERVELKSLAPNFIKDLLPILKREVSSVKILPSRKAKELMKYLWKWEGSELSKEIIDEVITELTKKEV